MYKTKIKYHPRYQCLKSHSSRLLSIPFIRRTRNWLFLVKLWW